MLLHPNTLTISLLWTIACLRICPETPYSPFLEKQSPIPSDAFYYTFTPLSSLLFSSCRHSVPSVPKPTCNWEEARPQTTKPSPPHNAGSTEGEPLPNAQNCSDENKLTAQSRTQVPSSLTCALTTDRRIPGRWLRAQRVFLLSVLSLQSSMSGNACGVFFLLSFFFAVVTLKADKGLTTYRLQLLFHFLSSPLQDVTSLCW